MKKFLVVLIIIFLLLVAIGGHFLINLKGYYNLSACRRLKSGISKKELIEHLGNPVHTLKDEKGIVLLFQTPSIMAGKIRALVDEETDSVTAIRCFEDGEWK